MNLNVDGFVPCLCGYLHMHVTDYVHLTSVKMDLGWL